MMRPRVLMLSFLTMIAIANCSRGDGQSTTSQAEYQPSVLIQKRGDLMFRPDNKSDYQPTSLNMELYPGYWLQQPSGGASKVRCGKKISSSQEIYKLIAEGEHSFANLGCPLVARTQSRRIVPRGGENLNIPFIIAPRRTAIFDSRPQIRWNVVSGVSRYTVSLEDQRVGEGTVWTKEVNLKQINNLSKPSAEYVEVDYPTDAPPLEPGVNYLAVVTTQQPVEATAKCRKSWFKQPENPFLCATSSTKDRGKGLGFYLLDETKIQQIQELSADIRRELDGEARALALAHLYQENNLVVDAIAILETQSKKNQNPGIYSFLGDLYHRVQLSQLAETRYVKAIELAKNSDNLVGQAMAQSGLSEVLAARGSNQKAIEIGQEAKNAYETLGDTAKAEKLRQKLSQWQRNS